ncbi:MFS transporter [Amycolatopsis sp. lyj-109]|uniref:MFS transporter n=1 Tax=Amycolatopsis sp. lyj-109 TaxID=2789287 RepID=UPI00397B306B
MSTKPPATRWHLGLWALVFVLSGNMLLDALEVSVVIVALPSISHGAGLTVAGAHWLMSGFALGFGGLLLFGGRVVVLLGRRRVYLAALLVFAAASLLAGLIGTPEVLIATRFVKGFCAALTAPTGIAIIGATFREGPDRNRAVSIYSLFGAAGFSAGLLLSGLFTQLDWRWVFLSPAPLAVVLFAFGMRFIPGDVRDDHVRRHYDVAGATCLLGAVTLLVYASVTAGVRGWTDLRVLAAFGLFAVLLAIFVLIEQRTAWALVRFGPLLRPRLIRSALGAAALNGSFWGFLFVCTFQLQDRLGWTPWATALAILPSSLLLALSAPFAGRMIGRFGPAKPIALGAAAAPLGYAGYLWSAGSPSYLGTVLPAMVLVGLGFVLAFAALHVQATSGVAAPELNQTTGVYQTSVQIGGAVILALVAGQSHVDTALVLVTAVGTTGFLIALTGISSAVPRPNRPRDRTST